MGVKFKMFDDHELDYGKSFRALDRLLDLDNGPKGWIDLAYDQSELSYIKEIASEIRESADIFIVCGVGGSYLGSRAVIEALGNIYDNDIDFIYTGNSLNPNEIYEILQYIKDKNVYINAISKSGTTMETNIAFSILEEYMFENYKKANDRIIITTGDPEGDLAKISNEKSYRTLDIKDDIGGRYSVMTPVGLLPIAVAGINIGEFLSGASEARSYSLDKSKGNIALQYSAFRTHMYESKKEIEILATYDLKLDYFGEWWRQLYGESQAKDNKGLYPSTLVFTRDLHSVGQLIQDGKRNIFETLLLVKTPQYDIKIPESNRGNDWGGKSLSQINQIAVKSAREAHSKGGVPNVAIEIDRMGAQDLGELMYFFMVSCAVNSYELGVNPFDQPGVEDYKYNIKKRLR